MVTGNGLYVGERWGGCILGLGEINVRSQDIDSISPHSTKRPIFLSGDGSYIGVPCGGAPVGWGLGKTNKSGLNIQKIHEYLE